MQGLILVFIVPALKHRLNVMCSYSQVSLLVDLQATHNGCLSSVSGFLQIRSR